MMKTTPLSKLMDTWCERLGASGSSVNFLFDGRYIHDGQTPEYYDMEDGGVIDTKLRLVGC